MAPKPAKKEPSKTEQYNKVVEQAALGDIQLTSLKFDVKPDFFSSDEKRKLRYDVTLQATEFEPSVGLAVASLTLSVIGTAGKKKALNCSADYAVVYGNLKDCDSEAVDAFLDRVAKFACFPYFRSLFSSLDWSAGLQLPPLPVLKEPVRQAAHQSRTANAE